MKQCFWVCLWSCKELSHSAISHFRCLAINLAVCLRAFVHVRLLMGYYSTMLEGTAFGFSFQLTRWFERHKRNKEKRSLGVNGTLDNSSWWLLCNTNKSITPMLYHINLTQKYQMIPNWSWAQNGQMHLIYTLLMWLSPKYHPPASSSWVTGYCETSLLNDIK